MSKAKLVKLVKKLQQTAVTSAETPTVRRVPSGFTGADLFGAKLSTLCPQTANSENDNSEQLKSLQEELDSVRGLFCLHLAVVSLINK